MEANVTRRIQKKNETGVRGWEGGRSGGGGGLSPKVTIDSVDGSAVTLCINAMTFPSCF